MTVKVFSEVLGREVELPEEPSRIVSLAPALTEILFLLGLGERVVGVSHFCNKPPKARGKPRLGSYFKVNVEKLRELRPDLVLVTTGAQRKVAFELADAGFPVYPVPLPVSLSGVISQVVTVGLVTGALEEARRLERSLVERASRLPRLGGVRVYYEIDLGGPVSVGGHSYITDALEWIGLANVFSRARTPWIIGPSDEEVRGLMPEVIVYEKAPYKEVRDERIIEGLRERLRGTPAVEEDRIIILGPDSLAHYGPSLLDALEDLASRVGELF